MNNEPNEITITRCRFCPWQSPTEAELPPGVPMRCALTTCPECRLKAWNEVCPAAFLNTQEDRLPRPGKLAEVMGWRYGPKGLLLHGETGTGKSRCAWKLAEREYLSGRTVAVVTSHSLGIDLPAKFTESAAAARNLTDRWRKAEVLLLDDPFKVKLTERVEETVFELVDYRTAHGLPIIITTNDTGETLLSRMSPDRGPALLRRLREFCQCIQF